MEIIVHYPETPEGRAELEKRVAQFHARAVLSYVQKLHCPYEQKLALINAVADTVRQRAAEENCNDYFHAGGNDNGK